MHLKSHKYGNFLVLFMQAVLPVFTPNCLCLYRRLSLSFARSKLSQPRLFVIHLSVYMIILLCFLFHKAFTYFLYTALPLDIAASYSVSYRISRQFPEYPQPICIDSTYPQSSTYSIVPNTLRAWRFHVLFLLCKTLLVYLSSR